MNVKELFAKSEEGTLTYDQFKALADENKSKFVDLSEGRYVDRNKYEDEVSSRDTRITTLNETITTRDADLANLKKQLEDAGQDATKLADLTTQFTSLQGKYDEEIKKYEAQLTKQKYDFAVKDIASKEKFTSAAAKNYFMQTLSDKNLSMEGDKIVGVEDFIEQYKQENEDSFIKESNDPEPSPEPDKKLPSFAAPSSSGNEPTQPKNPFGWNYRSVR